MFNVLDLVIIGVIFLSAVLAAWRGFTREVLSIGSWIGAAVIMFLLGPKAVPLAQQYVEKEIIAQIAAYAAVFVIALIPLTYISYRIAEGVRGSAIGPIDRLLGFAFGGARGLVVIGVGFLVFTSLVGEKKLPEWFSSARLYPLMAGAGNVIAQLLPERGAVGTKADEPEEDPIIGGKKAPRTPVSPPPPAEPEEPVETVPAPKPKAPKPAEERPAARAPRESGDKPVKEDRPGYGEREREALDQLIGSATASPAGTR